MRQRCVLLTVSAFALAAGCAPRKYAGSGALQVDELEGYVQLRVDGPTTIKAVGVPSADIQSNFPDLFPKVACNVEAGTFIELRVPPIWIQDPNHHGNLLVVPKGPVPGCAVDFSRGGYVWKEHVLAHSNNLKVAAPGGGGRVTFHSDSWFKHGTAESGILPEDPAFKCRIASGQSFALKAPPVQVGEQYFVDMVEGVPGCGFLRGFIFKGHVN